MSDTTYTRDQVADAVNAGAGLVLDGGLNLGERDEDVINLIVNAALAVLDMPGATGEDPKITLDEVMDQNYDGGAAEVRSWWSNWS
ncbi:hypothetical protein [Streptomyces demainii]|uniref:Pterin-binding domain-containing protein n=1 Tax=Streptomyces demainii TaxID=588122 RepID=A0ABT9KT15_9ACTN|nr:hypothetical protein [Streptomyces demainii]MDP9611562.1 hypothetical protein [Streptomyces demainii]